MSTSVRYLKSHVILIRQLAEELKSHTAHLQQQEEVWRREQQMLSEAEDQRRKILLAEENKLTEQRIRYFILNCTSLRFVIRYYHTVITTYFAFCQVTSYEERAAFARSPSSRHR